MATAQEHLTAAEAWLDESVKGIAKGYEPSAPMALQLAQVHAIIGLAYELGVPRSNSAGTLISPVSAVPDQATAAG